MTEAMWSHTVNVPLLRKILEHITAHPEEWHQEWWAIKTSESSCGTACCVAGWAAFLGGYSFRWGHLQDNDKASVNVGGKAGKTIPEIARKLLGLNQDQGTELFYSGNTLKDLWADAHEFTNGEIEIPEEFK